MMQNDTIDKMFKLKLVGMAKAYEEQISSAVCSSLSFEERIGLMVDKECTFRENERLQRLLKNARFKYSSACMEDIDYRARRGIEKSFMASISNCTWIHKGHNILITGATGTGKTWIACAIGNKSCRNGLTTNFQRVPLLLEELQNARKEGALRKLLRNLAKYDLLILDDIGIGVPTAQMKSDFLELVECRADGKSTIFTSQLEVSAWHDYFGSGSKFTADAILDRITSSGLRLSLSGESMRRLKK